MLLSMAMVRRLIKELEFDAPGPWNPEEVEVYYAKIRQEMDQKYSVYQLHRRFAHRLSSPLSP